KVLRYWSYPHPLQLPARFQHVLFGPSERGKFLKRSVLRFPLQVLGHRQQIETGRFRGALRVDRHQSLRLWRWKRLPQNPLGYAENGAEPSNAQRQRKSGRERESRTLAQRPRAEPHIAGEALRKRKSRLLPVRFLRLLDSSEFP